MKKRFAAGERVVETRWLVSKQISATISLIDSADMVPVDVEDVEAQWELWIWIRCRNIRRSRHALRKE